MDHFLFIIQVALLVSAAWTDIARRIIPNSICLALVVIGILNRLLIGPMALATSLTIAAGLLLVLLLLHSRSVMGGGDVKLLVAIAIGLSPIGLVNLLAITALSGGLLVLVHLTMRYLPRPRLSNIRSSMLRRVYTVERWRILRHAPLPYGVAIACGGILVIIQTGV